MHQVLAALLGAVFVVSAVAKLIDLGRWRAHAGGLGAPRSIAVVLPWLELVVGATVAVDLLDPVPAVIALVMLVAFTAVIVANLRAGRRPPCACFGAWSAAPISWRDVARNAAFIALAVAVIAT